MAPAVDRSAKGELSWSHAGDAAALSSGRKRKRGLREPRQYGTDDRLRFDCRRFHISAPAERSRRSLFPIRYETSLSSGVACARGGPPRCRGDQTVGLVRISGSFLPEGLGVDGQGTAGPDFFSRKMAYGRERQRRHSQAPRPVKRAAIGAASNRGREVNRDSANSKRLLVFYGVSRASAQVSSASRAGHSSCPHSVRPYSTFGGT
jgi:hypothetical protein